MIAVGHFDEEGVCDRHRIDLNVDIDLDESSILLIGVRNQVNSRDVSEGSFVIRVDFVHLEPILK